MMSQSRRPTIITGDLRNKVDKYMCKNSHFTTDELHKTFLQFNDLHFMTLVLLSSSTRQFVAGGFHECLQRYLRKSKSVLDWLNGLL